MENMMLVAVLLVATATASYSVAKIDTYKKAYETLASQYDKIYDAGYKDGKEARYEQEA